MNDMAKVVHSVTGQSVELPEGFRFDAAEVRISREGHRVVLESVDFAIDAETGLTITALRALIDEGDEGPDELWDAEAIKQVARAAHFGKAS